MVSDLSAELKRITFVTRAIYVAMLFTYPFYYFLLATTVGLHDVSDNKDIWTLPVIVTAVGVFVLSGLGAYIAHSVYSGAEFYEGRFGKFFKVRIKQNGGIQPSSIFALYVVALTIIQASSVLLFALSTVLQNAWYYQFFIMPVIFFFAISYPKTSKLEELIKGAERTVQKPGQE
ncbi:MAG TPA: hypothetical protein P5123_01595 [Spirochaetota bacterium]|nr:hypothetical protein [Spirochaetota bacterium]